MAKDELFSGESKNIEYKVVVPDKSEKYMKTVVAFANTQGGRLVIGIDDKTHKIIGVDNDILFQTILLLLMPKNYMKVAKLLKTILTKKFRRLLIKSSFRLKPNGIS